MRQFFRNLLEKHRSLLCRLGVFLLFLTIYAGKFFLVDRYDASRYTQFYLNRNMADTGIYLTEEDLHAPHALDAFFGKHIVERVILGEPEKRRGVYWYQAAEKLEGKPYFQLYSEEPVDESLRTVPLEVDGLVTGRYSVPNTNHIGPIRSGELVQILSWRTVDGTKKSDPESDHSY